MNMNTSSRMSALAVIDDFIKQRKDSVERYIALRNYLVENPPPPDVEELIWSLVVSRKSGYYD